jgi:hypothetical protein
MSEQNLNVNTTTTGRKPTKPPPGKKGGQRAPFGRYYKHWRSGQVYDAWDYGHKAWPLGKQ